MPLPSMPAAPTAQAAAPPPVAPQPSLHHELQHLLQRLHLHKQYWQNQKQHQRQNQKQERGVGAGGVDA